MTDMVHGDLFSLLELKMVVSKDLYTNLNMTEKVEKLNEITRKLTGKEPEDIDMSDAFKFFCTVLDPTKCEEIKPVFEELIDTIGIKDEMSKLRDDLNDCRKSFAESIRDSEPIVYEGESEIKVDDPRGQEILDKYMTRDLNGHARDMISIFQTLSFSEIFNHEDTYIYTAFCSSPLCWILQAEDEDFQKIFMKDIDRLVENTHHNKKELRTILEYLHSKMC